MSTKAPEKDTTMDDALMEEFHRGQRSSQLKGVLAVIGALAVLIMLFYAFTQMASVG